MTYKDFHDRYPYSNKTKERLRKEGFKVSDISDELITEAAKLIIWARDKKEYEVLEGGYKAFPVAKMILYVIGDEFLKRKFAQMFADFLDSENKIHYTLLEDFGIKYEVEKEETVVRLQDYLKTNFSYAEKIVNLGIEKGKVYLDYNEAKRFVKGLVFNKVYNFPEIDDKKIKQAAKEIKEYILVKEKSGKKDGEKEYKGVLQFERYAPCMKRLFKDLKEGKKLNHMEHFYLAVFLKRTGWKKEEILKVYMGRADYNEKIAKYQIDRIWDGKFSVASCEKMKAYNICKEDCGRKNPFGRRLNE